MAQLLKSESFNVQFMLLLDLFLLYWCIYLTYFTESMTIHSSKYCYIDFGNDITTLWVFMLTLD